MRYSVHTRHNTRDGLGNNRCELEIYEPRDGTRLLAAFAVGHSCTGLDTDDMVGLSCRYTESVSGVVYSRVGRILEDFASAHTVTSSRSIIVPDFAPEPDYSDLIDPEVVAAETAGLLATTSPVGSS